MRTVKIVTLFIFLIVLSGSGKWGRDSSWGRIQRDLGTETALEWTPAKLGSDVVQIWWDASSGVYTDASGQCSLWTDRSGNGSDGQPPSASKRALYNINQINGRPALQFDEVDDTYQLSDGAVTLSSPHHFIVILFTSTTYERAFIFADGDVNDTMIRQTGAGSLDMRSDGGVYRTMTGVTQPTTSYGLLEFQAEGDNLNRFWNGTVDGVATGYSGKSWKMDYFGSISWTNYIGGYLAEYILCDGSKLSSADVKRIRSYLNRKYRLYQ